MCIVQIYVLYGILNITSLQSIPRDLKYIISISDSISEMRYADLSKPLSHRLMLVRTWNNDRTDRNFLSFGKRKKLHGSISRENNECGKTVSHTSTIASQAQMCVMVLIMFMIIFLEFLQCNISVIPSVTLQSWAPEFVLQYHHMARVLNIRSFVVFMVLLATIVLLQCLVSHNLFVCLFFFSFSDNSNRTLLCPQKHALVYLPWLEKLSVLIEYAPWFHSLNMAYSLGRGLVLTVASLKEMGVSYIDLSGNEILTDPSSPVLTRLTLALVSSTSSNPLSTEL